jgi:hypothetical protein
MRDVWLGEQNELTESGPSYDTSVPNHGGEIEKVLVRREVSGTRREHQGGRIVYPVIAKQAYMYTVLLGNSILWSTARSPPIGRRIRTMLPLLGPLGGVPSARVRCVVLEFGSVSLGGVYSFHTSFLR